MAREYYDPQKPSGYSLDDHYLRIGDTQFLVPPTAVQVHRQMKTQRSQLLRSRNSVPKESEYFDRIIELTLFFPDAYAINNELRPLLAQSKKCPFLPIENTYLNEVHDIEAITVSNISVQTTPGFPETLQAIIQCYVFDPRHYFFHTSYQSFDDMIDWPLFRWHYQRSLTPPPLSNSDTDEGFRQSFRTYFEPLRQELNDSFVFRIADEQLLEEIQKWRMKKKELFKLIKNDLKNKPGIDEEDWEFNWVGHYEEVKHPITGEPVIDPDTGRPRTIYKEPGIDFKVMR